MLRTVAAAAAAATVGAASPPNFILLMSDDMGFGDVSYNNVSSRIAMPGAGGDRYTVNPPRTPHIDEMANGPNSVIFHRFYAGSGVCSPTRAAALTGRTPDRECIFGAEGCGQEPAWNCADNLPLSPNTFTIAEAAKTLNYSTLHVGKWHLGNFFPKASTKHDFANDKWPVSSPRVHGFDEWHSTEASASSSMCNCGCDPAWPHSPAGDPNATQGVGCVTGGGDFTTKPMACTNYWSPTDLDPAGHAPTNPNCSDAAAASLGGCVGNLTRKLLGDDTMEIMDQFEEFLQRKAPGGSEEAPFVAVLWLHTNHVPHPAMPEWYHAYTDAEGQPAGDYLGTISQMDVQVGRLRALLRQYNVADNTALFFTADNGPHLGHGDGRSAVQATNGLRQCKASLYEGGIRVAGVLEWPNMIKAHRETEMPAYVSDYLPTFLEAAGIPHVHPDWPSDGVSLLPFLKAAAAQPASEPIVVLNRTKPLGFELGKQQAWVDNEWKLVRNGVQGQCPTMEKPYKSGEGEYLFNLATDPTESHDLSQAEPARFAAMRAQLDAWAASIKVSQTDESECLPKGPAPGPAPSGGVELQQQGGGCLVADQDKEHTTVSLGVCNTSGSKWTLFSNGTTHDWATSHSDDHHHPHGLPPRGPPASLLPTAGEQDAQTLLKNDLTGSMTLKRDAEKEACEVGDGVWMGKQDNRNELVVVNVTGQPGAITMRAACGLCLGIDADSKKAALVDCGAADQFQISQ